MRNTLFKRIGAYAIDYLFIFLLLTMLNQIRILNPNYDEYMSAYDEYVEIYNDMNAENVVEIAESAEYQKVNYDLSRYGLSYSIISIIVYLAYFVGFQKWNKNQTLGKKMFNIKVASNDDAKVKWWQMLLRCVIVYNVLIELVLIILVLVLNYQDFTVASSILTLIASIIFYVNVFFIIFRKDGRGLHDLLAKTKVEEISNGNR